MSDTDVKVAYVLGYGRSGSTVLGNILGELDGFFAAGEVHWLWQRSLVQRCGCGDPVPECLVWAPVLERLGYPGRIDPREIWARQARELRVFHTPRLLRRTSKWPTGRPDLDAYGELLAATYRAAAEVTGARVIVDTSKLPSAAALVGVIPGIEAHFIHLVRDPRAVSFSWTRRRQRMGVDWKEESVRHGPFHSTMRWLAYNLAAESLRKRGRRVLTVRYEDFTANPKATIETIGEQLGVAPESLPFGDDHTVNLGTNHNVVGNPSRFRTGAIEIRADDEWIEAQRRGGRAITTLLASPWLRRYGYGLRPVASGSGSSA